MAIPIYKLHEVLDAHESAIISKLESSDIGERPTVFDLTSLGSNQLDCFRTIAAYLKNAQISFHPYPCYFLLKREFHPQAKATHLKKYIFQDIQELPFYFKRKHATPNIKENLVLSKVTLKQENLKSIEAQKANSDLASYALKHRTLYKKQQYLNFLQFINTHMKTGQK